MAITLNESAKKDTVITINQAVFPTKTNGVSSGLTYVNFDKFTMHEGDTLTITLKLVVKHGELCPA